MSKTRTSAEVHAELEQLGAEENNGLVGGYSSGRLMQALIFALALHAVVLLPGALFGHSKANGKDAAKTLPATPAASPANETSKAGDAKKPDNSAPVPAKPAQPKNPDGEASTDNATPPASEKPTQTTPDKAPEKNAPTTKNAGTKKADEIPSIPTPGGLDDSSLK